VLKEKFRLLKECLRKWNKKVFDFLDLNNEKTVKKLNDFEGLLGGDDTNLYLTLREGLNSDFWRHSERWVSRPNLNGIQFHFLSEEDNILLMSPFSIEEVKEVIWSSDGSKCPSPYGFNFKFLKVCWDIIKDDIMDFLHEFMDY
jgi:hypothetical protein